MNQIPFRYDPAHTALIVVDVQNDFCSPEGSLAKVGNDVSAAVTMVPRLQRLIDAARAAELPVIFIQTLHALGQRRLAAVQDLGRLAQVAQFGDDLEVAKIPDLYVQIITRRNRSIKIIE